MTDSSLFKLIEERVIKVNAFNYGSGQKCLLQCTNSYLICLYIFLDSFTADRCKSNCWKVEREVIKRSAFILSGRPTATLLCSNNCLLNFAVFWTNLDQIHDHTFFFSEVKSSFRVYGKVKKSKNRTKLSEATLKFVANYFKWSVCWGRCWVKRWDGSHRRKQNCRLRKRSA